MRFASQLAQNHFYIFKDGNGDSVAEYHLDHVIGWRIKQITG